MKRRNLLKAGGVGALALGASASAKAADDKVFNWKLVMSWPKKFPGLASSMDWFVDEIKKISNGRLNITLYGAGELVPAFEVFNAVSDGTAEMGHGTPYYWKGKITEAEVFTSVPFGMEAQEFNSWFIEGDGQKLLTEVYKPFGVKPFLGGNTLTQMGGWFNKEINSIEDLKGLKIRMPGIAGEVYKMSGASPVSIPGAEIFTSMQSGVLDATDWVGPWNDLAFGLQKAAKYYYNGWQEPSAFMEILVNEKVYETLPSDLKDLLDIMTFALNQRVMSEFKRNNAISLKTLIDKYKVQIRSFPKEVILSFKANTEKYLDEFANKSELAKRIIDSYRTYLAEQIEASKNRMQIEQYRLLP
ncbi:TRAP transporter substrate-binding protein [Suttonella ornithocola]|uniref:Neu5Ac-binding protein n=1 Tax=Suttonella ornithocola TaxID=279832 RepID=A0A380MXI8_9GAMM|nr:TRAP transporter substrate-binding protein [Suttonella ornithocola]SUO97269.1 Neu5Ac-binding protein [Suttonella ornithocola]